MTPAIILSTLRAVQSANPVAITIRRGPQTCRLTAAPAQTTGEMIGQDGSLTKFLCKDWLIAVADFTLTSPAEPKRGDEITVDVSGKKYLVSHPDGQSPESTPYGDVEPVVGFRVHSVPN